MVSISPRLRDSLDYEEPEKTDPRLSFGFRTLSINSAEYEHHDPQNDQRPFSAASDPSAARRKRRQRRSEHTIGEALDFQYDALPFQYQDEDRMKPKTFRVATLLPGRSNATIECRLDWEWLTEPASDYRCLSYCWETTDRSAAVLCNDLRLPVTRNLHKALQNVRKPNSELRIWIDQICINQDDYDEEVPPIFRINGED